MTQLKSSDLVFFHSPQTRSTGVWILLEELSAEYEKKVLYSRKGELDTEYYRSVNPMRKVPALWQWSTDSKRISPQALA